MIFKKKKKKDEEHQGDVLLAKGIWLVKPEMNNGSIVMNCLLRSLIVFLLVFGSLGGFLSAFDISYHIVLVIVCYLILSMYFSFLYASSKMMHRDLGYLLFFAVFIMAIYTFRVYANSGFYVIINRILQEAKSFFSLGGIREYETQVQNDYLTVAIVAIFLGMALIIVLNIWLYSTMSVFWTLMLTFPLLFIPLYMKLAPDPLYMISLGAGYAAVLAFKANGHYLAFAWDAPFRIKGKKKDKVSYTQDVGVFGQLLLRMLAVGFCVVLLTQTAVSGKRFQSWFQSDRLREETADTIGNFLLLGFEGMFNHYSATGGLSGGQLGGVSQVRADYQTDLVVNYTPYSNEAVYLKGYTGSRYEGNRWSRILVDAEGKEEQNQDDNPVDYVTLRKWESMQSETSGLKEEQENGAEQGAVGRMDVKNVGANEEFWYYPYYTLLQEQDNGAEGEPLSQPNVFQQNTEKTYTYYPKINWESAGNTPVNRLHTEEIADVLLEVPENNQEVINQECERIGLHDFMTENEIIEAVKAYFEEQIPYTLKPGATPKEEDFVNYFLTQNRKGYCAHFASAATLIFRNMGIPARYVEGYAFDLESVLASDEALDKKYEDYYQGYSALGKSTVMEVKVNDSMAHAWVEVYLDGFGWKVVEVTPGSNEAAEEDSFWSAFSSFLDGANGMGIGGNAGSGLGNIQLSQYFWLAYVMAIGIMIIVMVDLARIVVRKGRRYRACHQSHSVEAVIARYADVCDQIRLVDETFASCKSHREQLLFMSERYAVALETDAVSALLERISYSNQGLTEQEEERLIQLMKSIRKAIWKKVKLRQKIALCRR